MQISSSVAEETFRIVGVKKKRVVKRKDVNLLILKNYKLVGMGMHIGMNMNIV